ncbi:uncharacterized protein PHACADRAFT_211587 [Phanerochaete carnosa HHB-10118-sp]|uniref:Major facilitator superfamily (MFS) profile domain-containing protein n=1 Tax=Phanerochaete carnosa (strain HHB-10118-sp) TaxID=650164 RepID=K5UR49_PHACS|nr:uncharacterized protein PHACADRAFT_211587 [Phanerochaete carnosa HHB-10118-sp]EKM52316.1 hypothetical protein PHACADRAFT_211587 [Phanerochaete carnosa HHB-10118-sp]
MVDLHDTRNSRHSLMLQMATDSITNANPATLATTPHTEGTSLAHGAPVTYRLYKRRFIGLLGLFLLNIVAALPNPWYGPIANNVSADFGFTLNRVNWLGNVINFVFLPTSIFVPFFCKRYGIRISCYIATFFLLVSGWIRYAGTVRSLDSDGSYALQMVGQLLAGVAQPFFQIIGPLYSETWFDTKSRTTATMLIAIANPIGGAISQVLAPTGGTPRSSILILAIICSAVVPCTFLVGNTPPTPPTYSAAQPSPPLMSLVRALIGREPRGRPTYMSVRERFDFAIMMTNFGILAGTVNAFGVLTGEDLVPYGYSDTIAGLMGATLLIAGIVAACVTSPLFDRVFTGRLAVVSKILSPALGALWLSLIWAVKENNTGGLFAIMALIGICAITLLPVALELGVEVTRNADGSSALLWCIANLISIASVLIQGALRGGPDAHPPFNMHRGLIFQGILVCCTVFTVFGLKGKHARREMDERAMQEAAGLQGVGGDSVEGLKQEVKEGESAVQVQAV